MTRTMGCFAALVATIVMIGGCGKDSDEGSVVDRQITNTQAYQLDIAYLLQMVNGLTWNAVPCTMDDNDPEQPCDTESLKVRTPDQFSLGAVRAPSGEISIKVGSPCFPKSQLDRNLVWPKTITKEDVT